MVGNINHHERIHFQHLHQRTHNSSKTGHLGSRIIRVRDGIHNVFHHKKTEGDSVKTGIFHRFVKKTPVGPLSGTKNRLSNGSHICVSDVWEKKDVMHDIEKSFNITITPIYLSGKEIGYIFGNSPDNINQIYLSCHGTKSSNSFIKPKGIDLKFVVPDNTTHVGSEMMDIANAARGKIIYEKPDEQIYDSKTCKVVPNYWLDGKREMHLGHVSYNPVLLANHIKELKNEGCTSNVMVLNPNAKNIQLTDVLQGLNDTFGRVPELISSNCRGDYSSGEEFPEKRMVVRED